MARLLTLYEEGEKKNTGGGDIKGGGAYAPNLTAAGVELILDS